MEELWNKLRFHTEKTKERKGVSGYSHCGFSGFSSFSFLPLCDEFTFPLNGSIRGITLLFIQPDSRLVGTGLEQNQKTHFREEAINPLLSLVLLAFD